MPQAAMAESRLYYPSHQELGVMLQAKHPGIKTNVVAVGTLTKLHIIQGMGIGILPYASTMAASDEGEKGPWNPQFL